MNLFYYMQSNAYINEILLCQKDNNLSLVGKIYSTCYKKKVYLVFIYI